MYSSQVAIWSVWGWVRSNHLRLSMDTAASLASRPPPGRDAPHAVTGGTRARNQVMPDFVTIYAQVQPDKPAVIDDRPDGDRHHDDLRPS